MLQLKFVLVSIMVGTILACLGSTKIGENHPTFGDLAISTGLIACGVSPSLGLIWYLLEVII